MSGEPSVRSGRSGGIFVAVLVAGSAVGVVGWYLVTNRHGAALDESGFDLSDAPKVRRAAPVAAASSAPDQPVSSLGMMKADAGVRIVDSNAGAQAPAGGAAAKSGDPKEHANLSFTEAVRKHEAEVRRFGMKMTNKYPVIRQYGREWMSHPDLKKLNDDFQRDHDPIAFMKGLSKAPSLGLMLKKYAGRPEMREFVVQGMKQAPSELTSSAMDVLQNDHTLKDMVANIAGGMGLPPSITALINGGSDKVDQKAIMGDMMNNPEMRKAMQQQEQQAPPVNLGR